MYYHAGKALVRTPLFPLTDLLPHDGNIIFSLDKSLEKKLADPVFLEALYWASPEVYQMALDVRAGNIADPKKQAQILHTLKKYMIRASSRCTPYGIFAGCGWQSTGRMNQGKEANCQGLPHRRVRVDIGFLQTFIRHLEQDDQIWPFLGFRINPTLYQMTETYRYTEQVRKGEHWNAQLSTIDRTELLDELFFHAKYAPLTMGQISDLIGHEESEEEKFSFVRELLSVQFLVTDLTLELVGDRQLIYLIEQLMAIKEHCKAVWPYIAFLQLLKETAERIEDAPIGALHYDAFLKVREQAVQLGMKSTVYFFQADLGGKPKHSTELDERALAYLWKGVEVLSRFTSPSPIEEALKRFRKLFLERYESQEVPLLEVLDNEIGIGFPASSQIGNAEYNAIYDEIGSFKTAKLPTEQYRQKWHAYLQKKSEQLSLMEGLEIELVDEEISAFESTTAQLANTVSVMCSVLSDGFLHIQSVGGSTANALLGRFAYLDEGIYNIGQTVADQEKKLNDQAVLAEVVFLPKGRVGNVSRRLRLYNYEIPCSENIVVSKTAGIPLSDLWVSIQGDEIVLRSKRLNKRVLPRLSSAHNYNAVEQPIYQFLGAIQHQGSSGLQLNWGAWAKHKKFLPRVRYKKVILQRACWHFDEDDYLELSRQEDPIEALKRLLKRWQVVPYVVLGEGDSELLIHIHEESYLQLLWLEWKKKKEIHLIEFLFLTINPTADVVLPHQFIVPFLRKESGKKIETPFIQTASVPRIFIPGSEWLFIKLYCGAFNSDKILVELIKKVGDFLVTSGYIDHYFFVRYTDPHYHIRFRMHIVSPIATNYAEVIRYFYEYSNPFIEAKLIWKVQFDTYVRELERYGAREMELSEILFNIDTQVVLQLLQEETVQDDPLLRLCLGVKNLDNWLDLFNLQLVDKLVFVEEMVVGFTKEFGGIVKTKLEKQYRELLSQGKIMPGSEYGRFFESRSVKLENITAIDNLASYMHMSMNRLFKANQRIMEFACYVILNKEYRRALHSNGKPSL